MAFSDHLQTWLKGELTQGKIMIGMGILVLIAFIAILKSHNQLLRGSLIPMGLIILILIGYGGYILQSRTAHVQNTLALYQQEPKEAIKKEIEKHTNDNKIGKPNLQYFIPTALVLLGLSLFFIKSPYYQGMVLGFILLFVINYVLDYGFVSRSETVLKYLEKINH